MAEVMVWLFFTVCTVVVASSKGRSTGWWAILGLLFSFLALIVVAILPSAKPKPVLAGAEEATPDTHVRCPACRELVRRDASRCKHCQITLIPQ